MEKEAITPPGFMTYREAAIMFSLMQEPDAAKAIKATVNYYLYGTVPDDLSGPAAQVFAIMQADIDRNNTKYAGIVERNRANIKKRYGEESTAGLPVVDQLNSSGIQTENYKPEAVNQATTRKERGAAKPRNTRETRFTPPTFDEVAEYVKERKSKVDPQEFIDFYAAKGWKIGRCQMKDWKAACRNAEKWDRWERQSAKLRGSYTDEDYNRGLDDEQNVGRVFINHQSEGKRV